MAKPRQQAPPQRLILDSGAVIALSRHDTRARAALASAVEAGADVSIPSVVLAETLRGGPADASVNRVVNAVGAVDGADQSVGRTAGALLGAAESAKTIDALVVATAIQAGGAVILTGDTKDLALLSRGHDAVVIAAL